LIVYDLATEVTCPDIILQIEQRCRLKPALKGNLVNLKDRLLPLVELVGSDGDLEFYRPAAVQSQIPSAQ
jgi:hypothetical protein